MLQNKTNFRVRYSETDQMGYVYYGNYAQYFEVGRVEWLRKLGVSYKYMEDNGIMLPVLNLQVKFLKPAKYDELLTLTTVLSKMPSVKIDFTYEIHNQEKQLLTTGSTSLVFIDMQKNKPTKAPNYILDKLSPYF